MKQNAIRTVFFLVCCLLVVLSPSFAATVKHVNGDIGYAEFKASRARPVSGAVTFYQLNADVIVYGQFNTGFNNGRSFATCKLLILTTPKVDLTSFLDHTSTTPFTFTLTGATLHHFKNKRLVVKCGSRTIGRATIKVIP